MANTYYSHELLQEKIKSMLDTKLDMNQFMHQDDSLTADAGMKIKIQKYTATDNIKDVAEGEGNDDFSETRYSEEEYEVITTQGRAKWSDEAEMRNPIVVDTLLQGQAENMVNDLTRKAIKEMSKSHKTVECNFTTDKFFDKVVDALAIVMAKNEDEAGYSLLISPKSQAYVRKQLGDDLKYVEAFVRTGYIGTVCGVSVYVSKAVPDDVAYMVHPQAITYFSKRGISTEEDRDKNKRENIVYIRKVGLVALTDENYLVMIAKPQSTAVAITAVKNGATSISGTCGADCFRVEVDVNGKQYVAIPSAGSWTVAVDAVATGNKVYAVAYAPDLAAKAATEVTVSAS